MKKLHILFLSILPALVILFCFLGFLVAPNDPEKVVITQSFLAPCAEYPLGTDQYGRCVFSRILYGGNNIETLKTRVVHFVIPACKRESCSIFDGILGKYHS